jgi:hypothetical protein
MMPPYENHSDVHYYSSCRSRGCELLAQPASLLSSPRLTKSVESTYLLRLKFACCAFAYLKGPDYIVHAIAPNLNSGDDIRRLGNAYFRSLELVEGLVTSIVS